jgi:hypothetical protein
VSLPALRILTTIAFVWATLLTVLSVLMAGSCTATKSQAYFTAMKSDLRNLAMAQEEYHRTHGRFAASIPELRTAVTFINSYPVTTTIDHASRHAWSATATNARLPRASCRFWPGLEYPVCEQQTTFAERNVPKPTIGTMVIETWLIWLSLLRRRRRAAISTAWRESVPAA